MFGRFVFVDERVDVGDEVGICRSSDLLELFRVKLSSRERRKLSYALRRPPVPTFFRSEKTNRENKIFFKETIELITKTRSFYR